MKGVNGEWSIVKWIIDSVLDERGEWIIEN